MMSNIKNIPKRRFSNFEDEWEEKKLEELSNIVRGASPRPIQDPKWFDEKSEIGWLRISDVSEQDGRIYKLEQRLSELGQQKTRVVHEPHLLMSIAATVGKPVINYVKTGVHDGFLIFLEPKFNLEFMFKWLEMYKNQWKRYGQPGSQLNLNSDIVKNQTIILPECNEQVAIGSFFQLLDQSITLHQHKLDKLKNLKKSPKKSRGGAFYLSSGALSIRSMNWSSFGVMMIWVRRLRCLPNSVELVATGLYSPRPPAVRRLGSTP